MPPSTSGFIKKKKKNAAAPPPCSCSLKNTAKNINGYCVNMPAIMQIYPKAQKAYGPEVLTVYKLKNVIFSKNIKKYY